MGCFDKRKGMFSVRLLNVERFSCAVSYSRLIRLARWVMVVAGGWGGTDRLIPTIWKHYTARPIRKKTVCLQGHPPSEVSVLSSWCPPTSPHSRSSQSRFGYRFGNMRLNPRHCPGLSSFVSKKGAGGRGASPLWIPSSITMTTTSTC